MLCIEFHADYTDFESKILKITQQLILIIPKLLITKKKYKIEFIYNYNIKCFICMH